MTPTARRLAAARALRLAATALAVGFPLALLVVFHVPNPPDAMTYLGAGERLNARHGLYTLVPGDRVPTTFVAGNPVPLLSPPSIGVVWRPLAALGDWSVVAWTIVGGAVYTAAMGYVVWRAWPTVFLAALLFEPTAWLVTFGNVHAYISGGAAALWVLRDRPRWGAVIAVTMTAMKLTPAPLLLWVLRDRRAWVPTLVTGLIWAAATELLAPGSIVAYLGVMRAGSGGVFWPVLLLGLVGTVLLPKRFGFTVAVATSIVSSSAAGIHWLALLPIAMAPWAVFPTAPDCAATAPAVHPLRPAS